jgi:hypothetical protein
LSISGSVHGIADRRISAARRQLLDGQLQLVHAFSSSLNAQHLFVDFLRDFLLDGFLKWMKRLKWSRNLPAATIRRRGLRRSHAIVNLSWSMRWPSRAFDVEFT